MHLVDITQSAYRKARKSLRLRGLSGTLWFCIVNIGQLLRECAPFRRQSMPEISEFDRKFGVDTSGQISLTDLNIGSENADYGVQYTATPEKRFNEMLGGLPIGRYEDFLFIDFGSGKGRTLLLASNFPFKKIIGVEFSPQLHEITQHNIRAYKNDTQRCKNLESVCMDAATYPIPNDPTVFYFYNPFQEKVMNVVLKNIFMSLEAHPREVFILYLNPLLRELFDKSGFLTPLISSDKFVVYATNRLPQNSRTSSAHS